MSDDREPSDFEVIRNGLLQLDPETRIEVVAAMKTLQAIPLPVAVRILADAGMWAAVQPNFRSVPPVG